jgi:pimeloyl-ACP methyl ester carboxylesterase
MPQETRVPARERDDSLTVLSSGEHPTHAVILVGGIYDDYQYWDSWKDKLAGPDTVVMGYDHDARTESMPKSAHNLASDIAELKERGVTDVTVVAHSLGSLISKGALDELAQSGAAANFYHLDLQAFGAPVGGFVAGDFADAMPGGRLLSNLIDRPMGPDIGPHSEFMKGLAQPWPSNMAMHLYVGSNDTVVRPEAASTKAQYNAVEANATTVTIIEGAGHVDYNALGPEIMNASRGEPVQGFQTVAFNDRASQGADGPATTYEVTQAPSPTTPAAMETAMSR